MKLILDLPRVVAAVVTVICMFTGDISVAVGSVLLLLNLSLKIKIG